MKLLRQVCLSELALTDSVVFLAGSPEAAAEVPAAKPALIGANQFGQRPIIIFDVTDESLYAD